MGNRNNLASADVSEADKIKAINKELSKFSQKYEDLPPRTQKYLLLLELHVRHYIRRIQTGSSLISL